MFVVLTVYPEFHSPELFCLSTVLIVLRDTQLVHSYVFSRCLLVLHLVHGYKQEECGSSLCFFAFGMNHQIICIRTQSANPLAVLYRMVVHYRCLDRARRRRQLCTSHLRYPGHDKLHHDQHSESGETRTRSRIDAVVSIIAFRCVPQNGEYGTEGRIRVWLFIGFVLGFSSIIAATWIMIADFSIIDGKQRRRW